MKQTKKKNQRGSYWTLVIIALVAAGLAGIFYSKPAPTAAAHYSYRIEADYPHDVGAYTQGLEWFDGKLIESVGVYRKSAIRIVDLETGTVEKEVKLADQFFGEGATVLDGKIYQVTWKAERGFIYDAATLDPIGEFRYAREGWGLTNDGIHLILSDGTAMIRYIDPETFEVVRRLDVIDRNRSVRELNELEYIDGEIWANVYRTDRIARIDPKTGFVLGWIDLQDILPQSERTDDTGVLNGIAVHTETGHILVTGKNWPRLYAITVEPDS